MVYAYARMQHEHAHTHTHTHACMHAVARESVAQDMQQQQCMCICAVCMYLRYSKKMCGRLCAHLCMHICSKHVLCLLLILIKVICFWVLTNPLSWCMVCLLLFKALFVWIARTNEKRKKAQLSPLTKTSEAVLVLVLKHLDENVFIALYLYIHTNIYM
jgi:hypothetical protein